MCYTCPGETVAPGPCPLPPARSGCLPSPLKSIPPPLPQAGDLLYALPRMISALMSVIPPHRTLAPDLIRDRRLSGSGLPSPRPSAFCYLISLFSACWLLIEDWLRPTAEFASNIAAPVASAYRQTAMIALATSPAAPPVPVYGLRRVASALVFRAMPSLLVLGFVDRCQQFPPRPKM